MPELAGEVVGSEASSARFLWDFCRTVADLIAQEHYGVPEEVPHQWYMGHRSESHESGRTFAANGMEVKKFSEISMSATRTQLPNINDIQYNYNADDLESSSIAHTYGKDLAGAESMTGSAAPWSGSPATLMSGANRIEIEVVNA
jgi:hypothetical protein